VLAGGNMWDSLSCLLKISESFDKNNPEIWTDSVARQMHHNEGQLCVFTAKRGEQATTWLVVIILGRHSFHQCQSRATICRETE